MKKQIQTFLFLLMAIGLFGQSAPETLRQKLVGAGFENIRVEAVHHEYNISFENNIYRWNVRALSTALDTISEYVPENSLLHVVQLVLGLPQIVTEVNAGRWQDFRKDTTFTISIDTALTVSYKRKAGWDKLRRIKPLNPNRAKFDLVFYPQFYLTNLTYATFYEIQFNIAPAVEVSFWKGMLLTAQVILPVYNYCKVYGEEGNKIRPGFLVLSQDFRLNGPWFGNVSIGNFNSHRYGIDAGIRHPFNNPRWDIGFNAGLTGSSVITNEGWELGDPDTFTFSLTAGYFWPRFNLRTDLKVGRFLQGDYGGRFDVTRMFGETSIGFYAAYTVESTGYDGHANAGFHFSIPFPPGKRFKHKTVRVNLPRYFDWEYNGATDLVYNRYYERRPNENSSEHYFNPDYIKNELLKNRHYK